jgi:DNA-binding NarL/FixJ family response regulator
MPRCEGDKDDVRVLVADDHSLFRDGVVSLLEAAGFDVVGQVGDGLAAVEAAIELRPDLVLMDITMPKLSGLEALRRMRSEAPEIQVVMLTVSEEDSDLLAAIRAGAKGFIHKSLSAQEFLDLVGGLERGEAALSRKTAAQLIAGLGNKTPREEDSLYRLTPREIELLKLVADGLSNKAIAQSLSVSQNTVKYHVRNILQKLGAQNRTEAVAHAIRAGLFRASE